MTRGLFAIEHDHRWYAVLAIDNEAIVADMFSGRAALIDADHLPSLVVLMIEEPRIAVESIVADVDAREHDAQRLYQHINWGDLTAFSSTRLFRGGATGLRSQQ